MKIYVPKVRPDPADRQETDQVSSLRTEARHNKEDAGASGLSDQVLVGQEEIHPHNVVSDKVDTTIVNIETIVIPTDCPHTTKVNPSIRDINPIFGLVQNTSPEEQQFNQNSNLDLPLEHKEHVDDLLLASPSVLHSGDSTAICPPKVGVSHVSPTVILSDNSAATPLCRSDQIFQSGDPVTPPPIKDNIEQDLRMINKIKGRFWGDEDEIVADSDSAACQSSAQNVIVQNSPQKDGTFTVVLSKSQKKKLKQKKKVAVKAEYNTRQRAGSQSISF